MNTALLIIVTLFASLSPLLTFANLWQVKEWRIDRLKEHLRNEGYFRQIFGTIRPCILGLLGIFGLLGILTPEQWISASLAALSAVAVLQFLLHKQPKPVWTRKAQVLIGSSLLLTLLIAYALLALSLSNGRPTPYALLLPIIIILQAPLLFISWTLFKPVDHFLKKRIMDRAKALRAQHPSLTVIGITGSVGKTTTKELLAHILQDQNPLVTPEHVNSEMGVSQWLIQKLERWQESDALRPTPYALIIEMGAYRRGEIATLCDIAKPNLGIVTFIGNQHIALFGSQEELCEAKGELIAALPEDGHAFLNGDSSMCAQLRAKAACPVTTVGTGGPGDLEAFEIEETPRGIRFRVGETMFDLPLHGTHNVTNVLLAIAVAEHLGIERQDIAQKLRTFSPPKQTFEVRQQSGVTVLDDTHNASPASFRAAIDWARTQPAQKKILLSSGLIELGQAQDTTHTELGALASGVFDAAVFLDKKSAKYFEKGLKKNVEILSKNTQKVDAGSLLVCEGRMSPSTIQKLLPYAPMPGRRRNRSSRRRGGCSAF